MTTHEESNAGLQNAVQQSNVEVAAPQSQDGKLRKTLLFSLLGVALFALLYDYKIARPAVEEAYHRITLTNQHINGLASYHRMTNIDVQETLGRTPTETFTSGDFTIEAYRWNAGMPLELSGLFSEVTPSVSLKTHDYYAVYRTDGLELAFVTHFKFGFDTNELAVKRSFAVIAEDAVDDTIPSMEMLHAEYGERYGDSFESAEGTIGNMEPEPLDVQ
jgi:hypothetical protein